MSYLTKITARSSQTSEKWLAMQDLYELEDDLEYFEADWPKMWGHEIGFMAKISNNIDYFTDKLKTLKRKLPSRVSGLEKRIADIKKQTIDKSKKQHKANLVSLPGGRSKLLKPSPSGKLSLVKSHYQKIIASY